MAILRQKQDVSVLIRQVTSTTALYDGRGSQLRIFTDEAPIELPPTE